MDRLPALPPTFTRSMALSAGLSDFRLHRLVSHGRVVRIRAGVYSRPEAPAPQDRASYAVAAGMAALSKHSGHHCLSHLSAAAFHGLPLPLGPPTTVHLTVLGPATQRSRRANGLRVHHADSYPPLVQEYDGVLVTTPAQTVADCLRAFGPRVSVPIADAALREKLAQASEIMEVVFVQCHWQGRVLRTDVALPLVDGRRESWLESYSAVVFAEWGIVPFSPQTIVLDERDRFVARVDGAWVADHTVLELDGRGKYSIGVAGEAPDERAAFEREKDRFDAIGNLGFERVRFGLQDLLHRRPLVETRVRDRRAAGRLRVPSGALRPTPDTGLRLQP